MSTELVIKLKWMVVHIEDFILFLFSLERQSTDLAW